MLLSSGDIMNNIIKYPMKTNKDKPLFEYLVRDNMKFDYYLFIDFEDVTKQARIMNFSGVNRVLIYENYFDAKTGMWYGFNTFAFRDGKLIYNEVARPELHLEFYVNAGKWLNPDPGWIDILNNQQ